MDGIRLMSSECIVDGMVSSVKIFRNRNIMANWLLHQIHMAGPR